MTATEELAILGVKKLDIRFQKIEAEEYHLSYSGGKDSHLVLWFIRKMGLEIKIVGLNTKREHNEIRERIYANCDEVLYPARSFEWVKEKYGIPCFTKQQDEYIKRYQRGSRAVSTMKAVDSPERSLFELNKTAKRLTLSGELHKVSRECCVYTKEKALKDYATRTGLKPIIGIRRSESKTRGANFRSCLSEKGVFTPLYDFNDKIVDAMYEYFQIEIPKIYDHIDRTGCIGCPYGKKTELELSLVTPAQRRYAIRCFKDSYDVKGIKYEDSMV